MVEAVGAEFLGVQVLVRLSVFQVLLLVWVSVIHWDPLAFSTLDQVWDLWAKSNRGLLETLAI